MASLPEVAHTHTWLCTCSSAAFSTSAGPPAPPLRSVVIMNVLVDDGVEAVIRDNSGNWLVFIERREPRGFTPGDFA